MDAGGQTLSAIRENSRCCSNRCTVDFCATAMFESYRFCGVDSTRAPSRVARGV